jgi:hypothetical protein
MMAETASPPATAARPCSAKLPGRGAKLTIPEAAASFSTSVASRLRNQLGLSTPSPVNQNGSFEFDRVLKSGYVQKRTQKTKVGDFVSARLTHGCLTRIALGVEIGLSGVAAKYIVYI